MTKTPEEIIVEMAKLTGEMVEAIAEQEALALHLVQAEVDALGNLVAMPPKVGDPKAQEEQTEAGFDNMPV
jgi:hypothetical protein